MRDGAGGVTSIRRRLLTFLVSSLVLMVAGAGAVTYWVALRSANNAYDRSLLDPAIDIAENLRIDATGAIVALTADHGMNAKTKPDGSPNVIYLQQSDQRHDWHEPDQHQRPGFLHLQESDQHQYPQQRQEHRDGQRFGLLLPLACGS